MLGDEVVVMGDFFKLHFTENNGMAFGLQFMGAMGKYLLTGIRIVAAIAIMWYLVRIVRQEKHPLFIYCIALIFAGATGNIIDSLFYGIIFNDSLFQIATLFPPEGGYSSFMQGKVVDMFAFSIFPPIFNIADASISVAVGILIVFQKRMFASKKPESSDGSEALTPQK